MGNANGTMWHRPDDDNDESYATTLFHALDIGANNFLTLKDLMDAPAQGLMLPHSLPALYFFDIEKNGRLTQSEFTSLLHYCQHEKQKVEQAISEDKHFRDLILRASKAGVKDCSVHNRSSFRRLSSYSKVRSIFSSRRDVTTTPNNQLKQSSDDDDGDDSDSLDNLSSSDPDLLNPQNRTAIDVAVLENIVNDSIHKLADFLHNEGSREKFMEWLWALADFNSSGVVTLEELRIFLTALKEDGIDLEELAFHKEGGEPLEVCIINEFDTTHAGLLSRDEFMVLADLVTREYEFWENRHLERIGDYELGRTIGRGSSGVVRLAFHVENRQRFAVKIIKKGKCSDLSRLDREIQSLMAAKHQSVVSLEEVLESESNIFIVMELCGGGSMVDIVRLYPEERMPEETARFFMRQVFEALEFLHSHGICHRDVRLDNFMLDNSGNAKITDFGHSGMFSPGWDLFSTALVGSVHNLSPEQIRGQVYSGEKIDIWSAGVAIYCLLVGHPPFYDSDVNSLVSRILDCSYTIPDFVSEKAGDLIKCMIRASPEERIPIRQMLHHPWFYDGPEYGPSMNVVVFPVDLFYVKRPDIAEMILAMTIYQHNLHFHLADTHNPMTTPDELRGQAWTLRCLCPRNDIKFTVSLFTKPPHTAKKKKKVAPGLTTCASTLGLLPASVTTTTTTTTTTTATATAPTNENNGVEANTTIRHNSSAPTSLSQHIQERHGVTSSSISSQDGSVVSVENCFSTQRQQQRQQQQPTCSSLNNCHNQSCDVSSARPPLQRKPSFKVTPMDIAAHIRAGENEPSSDPFDFDSSPNRSSSISFQDDLLRKRDEEKATIVVSDTSAATAVSTEISPSEEPPPTMSIPSTTSDKCTTSTKTTTRTRTATSTTSDKRKDRRGHHSRSHSLDKSFGLRRINRSATVDAFPYQKVIPQRKMPESVRNLDFGKPDGVRVEHDGGNDEEINEHDSEVILVDDDNENDYDGDDDETNAVVTYRSFNENALRGQCESAPITPTFMRATMIACSSPDAMDLNDGMHTPNMSGAGSSTSGREGEIAMKLVRHPSKTVSPQSPHVPAVAISPSALLSASAGRVVDNDNDNNDNDNNNNNNNDNDNDIENDNDKDSNNGNDNDNNNNNVSSANENVSTSLMTHIPEDACVEMNGTSASIAATACDFDAKTAGECISNWDSGNVGEIRVTTAATTSTTTSSNISSPKAEATIYQQEQEKEQQAISSKPTEPQQECGKEPKGYEDYARCSNSNSYYNCGNGGIGSAGSSMESICNPMQPFIEVRLQDGEAGLFLKICRKLKRICSTKLGEVADRRKHLKTGGRRSLSALRRNASARSIGSESNLVTIATTTTTTTSGATGGVASDGFSAVTSFADNANTQNDDGARRANDVLVVASDAAVEEAQRGHDDNVDANDDADGGATQAGRDDVDPSNSTSHTIETRLERNVHI